MQQRDAFRVEASIVLRCKPIAGEALSHTPAHPWGSAAQDNLINAIATLEREQSQKMVLIREKDPLVSDYLHAQDKKISLLMHHIVHSEEDAATEATVTVNISENGIAFPSENSINPGQWLTLNLKLPPNFISIFVFARCLRCELNGGRYQVAAKFHRLHESDRQTLARFVIEVQASRRGISS